MLTPMLGRTVPDWLPHKGDLDRIPTGNQSGDLGNTVIGVEGYIKRFYQKLSRGGPR